MFIFIADGNYMHLHDDEYYVTLYYGTYEKEIRTQVNMLTTGFSNLNFKYLSQQLMEYRYQGISLM